MPSSPYNALRDFGASSRALAELVGPMNFLHLVMAPWAINSIPNE